MSPPDAPPEIPRSLPAAFSFSSDTAARIMARAWSSLSGGKRGFCLSGASIRWPVNRMTRGAASGASSFAPPPECCRGPPEYFLSEFRGADKAELFARRIACKIRGAGKGLLVGAADAFGLCGGQHDQVCGTDLGPDIGLILTCQGCSLGFDAQLDPGGQIGAKLFQLAKLQGSLILGIEIILPDLRLSGLANSVMMVDMARALRPE